MENPKVAKNYTTIFRDGSVIHENPWFIFPDGHGKWYWDETHRGSVIHWFKPEVPYEEHKFYKLPDWELIELIINSTKYEMLERYFVIDEEDLKECLIKEGFNSYEQMAKEQLHDYYEGYKI